MYIYAYYLMNACNDSIVTSEQLLLANTLFRKKLTAMSGFVWALSGIQRQNFRLVLT